MMAGKHKNETKYRKEKQTDASAPLSILVMSILLALSPDRECSTISASQSGTVKWHDPDVTKPQYAERVHRFSWPRKYKKTSLNVTVSIFISYMLIQCF